jgi:alpha-L-fucosidase 2
VKTRKRGDTPGSRQPFRSNQLSRRVPAFSLPILTIALAASAQSPRLWYKTPATDWSQALPIGNGRLAGMVYGGIADEQIQLNEESIYAGKRMDRINPAAHENIPIIRRLLLDGKVKEAEDLADKDMLAIPRRQPPYEPLGDLRLHFDNVDAASVTNYQRSLDLYDGIASVSFAAGGVRYTRQVFASYPDHAIVLHLEASRPGALNFSTSLTRSVDATSAIDSSIANTLVLNGIALPPPSKNYADEPKDGAQFACAVRIYADGKILPTSNTYQVRDAQEATLILTAATNVWGLDAGQRCRQLLHDAITHPYPDLLARHKADFRNLATRVSLSLGDDSATTIPTDELLSKTAAGGDDRALTALYFAYGRYLLQSSSREDSMPANLQGKWNAQLDPSWGSKYTININTEMNYWPAEVCNLGETVDALYHLLMRMQDNGQETAHKMYGANGFVAHHNTDIWADTQPIDGVASGIWPMGAAWLTLSLWEHYEYSGDLLYLRERAYPLMRSAAEFLLNTLFDDGKGHLVSGPSLSPENRYFTPDHQKASLDLSPTMDVEITTALFRRVIDAATKLQVDAPLVEELRKALAKLMPLQIGRYGQLQEWRNDYEESEPGHRHLSHLFAVYPSNEINAGTPELYNAARISLERRLANGGGGTGWSRAWVVCLWATFGEGDKADDSLRVLFSKSTWPNLFDLHPPEIFQIDGNLGATAGIARMLIDRSNGTLRLLPALPSAWKDGRVTGLRATGGVTVDMEWKNGVIVKATLHSARPAEIHLTAQAGTAVRTVKLRAGVPSALRF